MRFLIGSLALIAIFFKKLMQQFKTISFSQLMTIGFIVVVLFLGFDFQTQALSYTSTTNVSIITSFNIAFVPFIAFVILKHQIRIQNLIAAGLGILSIWLLEGDLTALNFGDLLTFICAFFYALHIVLVEKFSKNMPLEILAIGQIFICSMLALIAALAFNETIITSIGDAKISVLLFVGLIPTALCFFLQNFGIKYTDESRASLILATEALWGFIFAIILQGESLTIYVIVGSIIMFLAVLIDEIDFNKFFKKEKI